MKCQHCVRPNIPLEQVNAQNSLKKGVLAVLLYFGMNYAFPVVQWLKNRKGVKKMKKAKKMKKQPQIRKREGRSIMMSRVPDSICLAVAVLAGLLLVMVAMSPSQAAGLLKPVNGGDEHHVFMKSHHVTVTINNGYARTEVDQVFGNGSGRDLRAVYSFPVPKQASLSELSMWIDGNEVVGEVMEKDKARQTHEDQVKKGNDTALAEKDEYKTFDVSIYPVRPAADTRVRLVYYQPITIDANIGRYVYPLAEGGVDEERIAFWSVDDKVQESFKFDLVLKSAFPVKEVRIPGFMNKAVINKIQPDQDQGPVPAGEEYHAVIDCPEGEALTRDVVCYYRLDDSVPARVELIPYCQGAGSTGTFMVVVTPAADLQRISEGVDWTFVLDTSGSMDGGKIATLVDGVTKVIDKMTPNDRFRIITFNDHADDFTGGFINATPSNVQSILNKVKQIHAGGCTNLFAGLKMAYTRLDDDRTTCIIMVTDGETNEGPTTHADFLALLKTYDVRLCTFVIGNSANQPLLDRLARDSNGFAMNVSSSDDIVGIILQAKTKILYEAMHDVELKFHGEKVTDLTPAKVGSLYQGQQLVMFGRYNGSGDVLVEMKARISGQDRSWKCTATLPDQDTDNPEIERLWAQSSIEDVMQNIREHGETDHLRNQVVALGEEYSLVTDYTSMLVVSETEMEALQIQRRNSQRTVAERQSRQVRSQAVAHSYRVDNNPTNANNSTYAANPAPANAPANNTSGSSNQGGSGGGGNNYTSHTWQDRKSPGISFGSGPVGPAFLLLLVWLKRKKQQV